MSASNDKARDPPPTGPATQQSGNDAGAPPADAAKRATPTPKDTPRRAFDDEDEDEWRHEPIAPVDERNPLKSLGRAVADVATSGSEPAPKPRDR
ncbi:MAG TPA: hypothetical protein VFF43_06255 [Caldimonas sp.]|nr:hypothetical protein [Caldimonas sp.]